MRLLSQWDCWWPWFRDALTPLASLPPLFIVYETAKRLVIYTYTGFPRCSIFCNCLCSENFPLSFTCLWNSHAHCLAGNISIKLLTLQTSWASWIPYVESTVPLLLLLPSHRLCPSSAARLRSHLKQQFTFLRDLPVWLLIFLRLFLSQWVLNLRQNNFYLANVWNRPDSRVHIRSAFHRLSRIPCDSSHTPVPWCTVIHPPPILSLPFEMIPHILQYSTDIPSWPLFFRRWWVDPQPWISSCRLQLAPPSYRTPTSRLNQSLFQPTALPDLWGQIGSVLRNALKEDLKVRNVQFSFLQKMGNKIDKWEVR